MSESPGSTQKVLLNYPLYLNDQGSTTSIYAYVYTESKEIRNSVVTNIRFMKGHVILPEQKAYVGHENKVGISLKVDGILSKERFFSVPQSDEKFQRVFSFFLDLKAILSMQFSFMFNKVETSFALSRTNPRRLSKSGPMQINVMAKRASGMTNNLGVMQESYISTVSSGSSNENSEDVTTDELSQQAHDLNLNDSKEVEQSFVHL